jgi:hypothetical protein
MSGEVQKASVLASLTVNLAGFEQLTLRYPHQNADGQFLVCGVTQTTEGGCPYVKVTFTNGAVVGAFLTAKAEEVF